MLVVAAPHVGHDDIALHQRLVEPVTTQASAGSADPAQPLGAGEELWRYSAIGRVGVLNVSEGVFGIPERLGDSTGNGLPDLLRPRRINVRWQQQDLEAHGIAPLVISHHQIAGVGQGAAALSSCAPGSRSARRMLLLRSLHLMRRRCGSSYQNRRGGSIYRVILWF